MSIAITDDHRALARTASDFLQKHDARGAARALLESPTEELPAFWGELDGLGWLGLHIAEEDGGSGFSLTELRRYDEAEAAYRASLALEPEHGGALAELAYIAKLKAGVVPEQVKLFNSEEARRRR